MSNIKTWFKFKKEPFLKIIEKKTGLTEKEFCNNKTLHDRSSKMIKNYLKDEKMPKEVIESIAENTNLSIEYLTGFDKNGKEINNPSEEIYIPTFMPFLNEKNDSKWFNKILQRYGIDMKTYEKLNLTEKSDLRANLDIIILSLLTKKLRIKINYPEYNNLYDYYNTVLDEEYIFSKQIDEGYINQEEKKYSKYKDKLKKYCQIKATIAKAPNKTYVLKNINDSSYVFSHFYKVKTLCNITKTKKSMLINMPFLEKNSLD